MELLKTKVVMNTVPGDLVAHSSNDIEWTGIVMDCIPAALILADPAQFGLAPNIAEVAPGIKVPGAVMLKVLLRSKEGVPIIAIISETDCRRVEIMITNDNAEMREQRKKLLGIQTAPEGASQGSSLIV